MTSERLSRLLQACPLRCVLCHPPTSVRSLPPFYFSAEMQLEAQPHGFPLRILLILNLSSVQLLAETSLLFHRGREVTANRCEEKMWSVYYQYSVEVHL